MSHLRWDFARLVHERGFRLTPQRQLVLDAVCAGGGHTTFDEIYARVHARASSVNRATVYRTLDFLCSLHLVVAADLGGGRTVYEIAGDTPHHHLVCRVCGGTAELSHAVVRRLFAQVERDLGFEIETDHLVLWGVCQACAPEAAAAPRPGPCAEPKADARHLAAKRASKVHAG